MARILASFSGGDSGLAIYKPLVSCDVNFSPWTQGVWRGMLLQNAYEFEAANHGACDEELAPSLTPVAIESSHGGAL